MRTELVTSLKRNATEILAYLEQDKTPILITQYGRPAAYLIDIETYEELRRRVALLEGIARGERAVADGRLLSHAEAKNRMSRWLK
jgi:prevent-host-death family protein